MKKRLTFGLTYFLLMALLMVGIWQGKKHLSRPEPTAPTTPAIVETEPPAPTEPETPAWAEELTLREITAPQYFVYNTKTDTFVSQSHDTSTRVYPASITKLMTCLVAVDYLKPQDLVTVGEEIRMIDWDSSVAGLQVGDTLTFSQLMEAMLLPSGNDAAYVTAVNVGRKILQSSTATNEEAKAAFVAAMNRKASALGMTGSHFENPDGIHADSHYMTMHDMARLGKCALANSQIRECVALVEGHNPRYDEDNTEEGAVSQWRNTNALINPDSPYYCPEAIGLKTGYTNAAGSCLLSAFSYGGEIYIVGVFQCPWGESKFDETRQIFAQSVVF